MRNAVDSIPDLVRHLEYDKEFKWLSCTECGDKTPPERFLLNQKCLTCDTKDAMIKAHRKAQWERFWNRRGSSPIEANPEMSH